MSVATETAYDRIGAAHPLLGLAVSPDDCSLLIAATALAVLSTLIRTSKRPLQ